MVQRKGQIWIRDWPALCLVLRLWTACESPIEENHGTLNLHATGCGVQAGAR
jgi:hypothetical protein